MLKFFRRRRTRRRLEPYEARGTSVVDTNPDLRVRNLMDDPEIRRLLVLDGTPVEPRRRFERIA